MEYSSYSSSIQKTSVFINPSLEISNGGISYFNTFLIDLTNCIVIESINRSKQSVAQSKYLSVDAVQDSINQIFSYELSEYIIDQSQGRIQHTSMKNLPKYNPESLNKDDISSGDEEEDEDVKDFEIIPRDSNVSAQNVSLFFPTELVYQVCQDMIRRKMTIHTNTSFYEPVQLQSRDSFIFTYLSYCMESVTTRILKRLSDSSRKDTINEDDIRKTISDDSVLTEIRHKAVQINNITNRLLEGHSIDSLPNLSSSLTTSTISSSEINKPVTQSPQSHHHQLDAVTLIGSNQPEEIKPNTKIIESPIIEPITNTNTTPTETTTTTQSPNINTAITPKVESPKQTTSPIISSPTTPTPVNIQDNTTATQTTSTITNTTTTTTKPNTQPTKETNQVTKRDVKSPTTTATTKTITSPIQTHVNLTAITIPSLIFVNKPFDLVQALKNDHILLEKSNGILLVFLILVGLLIQTV